MADIATAYVNLQVSTRDVAKGVKREFGIIERDARTTGNNAGDAMSTGIKGKLVGLAKVAGTIGLVTAFAAVGTAAGRAFADGFRDAADNEQAVGAVTAIFKDAAGQIEESAKGAARNVGLSSREYRNLASTLGASLKNKGIVDYADETENLIGLGSDLAAQFGGSTQQAVEALSSLLRGEADPIERYGISINETAVNAELARQGLGGLEGAALEQAKTQARLKLAFEQSADAQGTFALETGTYAGQAQIASAQWEDLKMEIGEQFLPVATKAMKWINDEAIPTFADWADKVETIRTRIDEFRNSASLFFQNEEGGAGIAAGFATIKESMQTSWDETLSPIFRDLKTFFEAEMPGYVEPLRQAWDDIRVAIETALGLIDGEVNGKSADWKKLWETHGEDIKRTISGAMDIIVGTIRTGTATISGIIQIWAGIVTGDWSKVGAGWSTITQGWLDGVGGVMSGLGKIFQDPINNAIGMLNGLLGAYNGVVAGLGLTGLKLPLIPELSWQAPVSNYARRSAQAAQASQIQAYNEQLLKATPRANGGIEREPQISSTPILWAEAGREAYIPLDPSKRKRSLSLWQQVGRELGATMLADGRVFPLPAGSYRQTQGLHGVDGGYDYGVPVGTPVMANAAATVTQAADLGNRSYGKFIRLSNGSVYAHLSQLLVAVGQAVAAGQRIGLSGNTGNSTGPHLHYVPAGALGAAGAAGPSMAESFAAAVQSILGGKSGSGIAGLGFGLAGKIGEAMIAKVSTLAQDYGVGVPQSADQWRDVVVAALTHVGQPASLASTVLRRLMQESSGNPRAINNWDINAKNGDPSKGLMQVIGSTFNAFRDRSLSSDIYDPMANLVASMRYALARYGSLSAAYNRPGGYASGTSSAAPGWHWVGENGAELMRFRGGEQILDAETSARAVASQRVEIALVWDDPRARSFVRAEIRQAVREGMVAAA